LVREKKMKNHNILSKLIILVIIITLSNAQSFRSYATGLALQDDLDLVYDPIELQFVDGIRLYTNLSNLTSYTDNIFDGDGDDEFLLGLSSKNPYLDYLKHSVLIKFKSSEEPLSVGLTILDKDGNSVTKYDQGTMSNESTYYMGDNNTGLYDMKLTNSQTKSNIAIEDSYTYIFNNTFNNKGGLTLGAQLYLDNDCETKNRSSIQMGTVNPDTPTFQNNTTLYNIEDNYNVENNVEDGDFNTEIHAKTTKFSTSAMLPLKGYEVRGDFQFYLKDELEKTEDLYTGTFEDGDNEIVNYLEKYSETHSYSANSNLEGSGAVLLGASLRKTFNKQDDRKNDGYWNIAFSMNFGSSDYSESTNNNLSSINEYYDGLDEGYDINGIIDPDDDKITTKSIITTTSNEGDQKTNSYNYGANFRIPLAENLHFGIGGLFGQQTTTLQTAYINNSAELTNNSYTYYEANEFMHQNPDVQHVSTKSVTSKYTADNKKTMQSLVFRCPVGLEYRIGKNKNWSIRFGSLFVKTSKTDNESTQITSYEPRITETVYTDGDVEIDYDESIYASTSSNSKSVDTATWLTYGLGYSPTENLQVDILGFAGDGDDPGTDFLNTGFLKDLRLSFTLKF